MSKDFKSFMWLYVHVFAGVLGGQERVSGPLEMELQAIVSSLTEVLGTELRSSECSY